MTRTSMTRTTRERDHADDEIFLPDVSDETLEAAAGAIAAGAVAAMTLPGGISINVMCCGGD